MQPDLNQKIKQNIFNLQASHEKLLLIYQGYRRQYVELSVSAIFVLSGCIKWPNSKFWKICAKQPSPQWLAKGGMKWINCLFWWWMIKYFVLCRYALWRNKSQCSKKPRPMCIRLRHLCDIKLNCIMEYSHSESIV